MKRKTNLFYTTGTDSNFLTFSNYTEGLTGNFLATNIKLFPSKFLCLNMPKLSASTKPDLIMSYLAAHYENKIAFLRDACAYSGKNIEKTLKPLSWLIESIYKFDDSTTIEYVGQVTEQDYNGIYADTICVIDSSACSYGTLVEEIPSEIYEEDYSYESQRYLYGWSYIVDGEEQYTGPGEYENILPKTDVDKKYIYNAKYKEIDIIQPVEPRDIRFNVVIPLFDVINTDYKENTDIIQSMSYIPCDGDYSGILNVPYGIWFSKSSITLSRDNTKWSPAWSLAIGSQFKPFPYSETPISEVNQSARSAAFMTFAQALVRQNRLLSKVSETMNNVNKLSAQVKAMEANIKSIGTSYNIDGLNQEIAELTSYMSNALNTMQEEIDEIKIAYV